MTTKLAKEREAQLTSDARAAICLQQAVTFYSQAHTMVAG